MPAQQAQIDQFAKAVREGNFDYVKAALANKQIPVNAVLDARGSTPIIIAVEANSLAMVEAILAHDPDLTTKNKDGLSPLALAEKNSNTAIAEALKAAGAKE